MFYCSHHIRRLFPRLVDCFPSLLPHPLRSGFAVQYNFRIQSGIMLLRHYTFIFIVKSPPLQYLDDLKTRKVAVICFRLLSLPLSR